MKQPREHGHEDTIPAKPQRRANRLFLAVAAGSTALFLLLVAAFVVFEKRYEGKTYPNVSVGGMPFGGKTPDEIRAYWETRNAPFADVVFELRAEEKVATVSGAELEIGYDGDLSASQAYLVGRSGSLLTDLRQRFFTPVIEISPYFRYRTEALDDAIAVLASGIDTPPTEGLFRFENGRVTAFKPSADGKRLDDAAARAQFASVVSSVPSHGNGPIVLTLPVQTVSPQSKTEEMNDLGISQLIGTGHSVFRGSIPGRVHNVALGASRFNGVLIPPGKTVSFNEILGDVSAATGYQSAYIIKNGRTVLGDGGGVCQVSSTLFRAALDAGLPIVERYPHAYRVHYYEDGGYKPGLDATVYAPSVDLKIANDTGHHILIQTKTDTKNMVLVFELYGTSDGRVAEISDHTVWDVTPPPEPLYQDDPTLPPGTTRQVDWAAWGAKARFTYRVVRGEEMLQDKTFYSAYRPWQAVYLKGPAQ